MSGPLAGVTVLDFSQMMAGPLCAMILGDLGADVIKIEPPEGDTMRRTGDTRIGGETEYFLSLNRNKRSLVLDLKSAAGREAAKSLARQADVVVENFRPGTMDRLGIGWDVLREINPRLIYSALSGFGEQSVHRERPALDPIIQAMSGIMQLTGTPESGPLRVGFPLSDYVTPLLAAIGITSALAERERSGQGQRVGLSMLDATVFSMIPREGYFFATGKTPPLTGQAHYQIVPYNAYWTADGRQIFVMAHTEAFWQALVQCVDDEVLATDTRFGSGRTRLEHREEVDRRLAEAFAKREASQWLALLAGAGALHSLVRTLDEVFSDPEVERDLVRSVEHPSAGTVRVLANPLRFSRTPVDIRRAPPQLDADGQAIRREFGL